jgi:hypothetical protein
MLRLGRWSAETLRGSFVSYERQLDGPKKPSF